MKYKTLHNRKEIIMADEELELDVTQAKTSKLTVILLVVLIVLVLVMGGIGAWYFLSKDDGGESTASEDGAAAKELKPLLYQTMVPEFVVNFGPGSKVRYLQVDLQIATRNEEALAAVNTYRPVLRNDILVLLSGLSFEELSERSGKEALQKQLLNVTNKIIVDAMKGAKKKDGADSKDEEKSAENKQADVNGPIENIYFLSFIMQ
jgi:flagellar FliL protein